MTLRPLFRDWEAGFFFYKNKIKQILILREHTKGPHMSKANEFCVEWCFSFQIVYKHGVLYFTSELKKIVRFAPTAHHHRHHHCANLGFLNF